MYRQFVYACTDSKRDILFSRCTKSCLDLGNSKFYLRRQQTGGFGMLFLGMASRFRCPLVQGWQNNRERN